MRQLILLFTLMLMHINAIFAQTTFQKQIGRPSLDDVITIGIENSHGEFINVGTGNYNTFSDSTFMYFIKLNSNGDTLATYRNQFLESSYPSSIVELPNDQGYIVSGYNVKGQTAGSNMPFFFRTDTNGMVLWNKSFVGYRQWNGVINHLILTPDNNIMLFGGTQDSTPVISGSFTFFAIKSDLNGNILWAKNYSKPGYMIGFNVCQTANGDFLYTGPFTANSGNNIPAMLIRTDSTGNILWTKTYSDSLSNTLQYKPEDIKVDQNGNIILVGTAYYYQVFRSCMFLMKFNSSGDMIFNRIYGDSTMQIFRNGYGMNVSINRDGYSIMGGSLEQSPVDYPAIIMKTDTSGFPIWTKFIRANNAILSTPFTTRTSDNGYLMSSYQGSFPDGRQGVIIKVDSMGDGGCNSIDTSVNYFTRSIVAGTDNLFTSVPTLYDSTGTYIQYPGSIVLTECSSTGTPCSANFQIYPDTLSPHHYIVVNNASGIQPLSYLWNWGDNTFDTTPYPSHTYSTPSYYDICLTIIDSTGCTNKFCENSYLVHRNSSSNTIIYLNVYSPATVGEVELQAEKEMEVYPNPTRGIFIVRSSLFVQPSTVSISDIVGNVVYSKSNTNNYECTVDANLTAGVYFVNIKNQNGAQIKKIIVQ